MPSVALSHSVNSSGRMGLYVDSSSCSCDGCRTYRLQTLDFPLWDAADAHLFVAPAPSPTPAPRATPPASSGLGQQPLSFSMGVPALSRTVTGLGYQAPEADDAAPTVTLARSSTVTAEPSLLPRGGGAGVAPSILSPPRARTDVDALMDGLRTLRAELQTDQDNVYSGVDARSHDEMAARDTEWDELDRKIHAIEQCMLSFGAIFRTR